MKKTKTNKTNKTNKTRKIRNNININPKLDSKAKQQFLHSLQVENKDNKNSPQNDFYSYINYSWLENISKFKTILHTGQKYITKVDNFRLVQDKVLKSLNTKTLNYIKTNKMKNAENYYDSAFNRGTINNGKKWSKIFVDKIDEIRQDKKNLWKMLAYVNKYEFVKNQSPIIWEVSENLYNNKELIPHLNQHIFAIEDVQVYDKNIKDNKTQLLRSNFNKTMKKLFDTIIGKNKIDYKKPFEVACKIFNVFGYDDKQLVIPNKYNYYLIEKDELETKYGFNWNEFCIELGYQQNNIPSKIGTNNPYFLKGIIQLLQEEWNSEEWRPFWIWLFLRQVARLTNKWVNIFYGFYGKIQKGQQELIPQEASSILFMSFAYNNLLSKIYIKEHLDKNAYEYTKILYTNIKQELIGIITHCKWMDNKTKHNALDKLTKIKLDLGYNTDALKIRDPNIKYDKDDLILNIIKICEYRNNQYFKANIGTIPYLSKLDWNMFPLKMVGLQPYIVNAYYFPSKNSIYVPLAYMQYPFIDLVEQDETYNLANIGFTMAHELSHSLDNTGSLFDANGNLNDWYTKESRKKFELKQKNIVNQYDLWAKKDGIIYDTTIGIGENIADISAVQICENYLLNITDNDKLVTLVKESVYKNFYVYFAFQMRQKLRKYVLRMELLTNPHALDKYRTNIPLSRSKIYSNLYKIKSDDKMYWPNAEQIW